MVGLVFPTQRNLLSSWKDSLPFWKFLTYLQGSSCHFESMASMDKATPLGCLHMKSLQWYLETLRISLASGYPTFLFLWLSGIIFSGRSIIQF